MARHFVVLATVALCLVAATMGEKVELQGKQLEYQLKIYKLLYHVDQAEIHWNDELAKFNIEDFRKNVDNFNDVNVVNVFWEKYGHGILPRGQVFSVAYKEQLEEMISLYRVFMTIKNFEDFYSFALWARLHVNEMMFMYALKLAVIHRPDTKYIRLPAMYETYPYFFYNMDVMHKAKDIRIREKGVKNYMGLDDYLIPANYSGWYIQHDDDNEWMLNYLTEDIDWNNFYFYVRQELPFWLSSSECSLLKGKHHHETKRGEDFYFVHRQLINRYNLERRSNDMKDIEDFSWDKEFSTGYYPTMTYHNGLPFPQRKSFSEFPHHKLGYVNDIERFEMHIKSAIDSGYILSKDSKHVSIYTPEGFELLTNIIEGNADSYNKNFYGSLVGLGHLILGFNVEPSSKHQVVPSALEYYSTSLRDPAFYRLYKKILDFINVYKSKLPVYTHDELLSPGIEIKSLVVDKITTYFEYVDVPINNVIPVKNAADAVSFGVNVRQKRLNYNPFTYHFTIQSNKATKSFIRIFLGPKYDYHHNEIDISDNWKNFLELDLFMVELKPGMNKIERKSTESIYTVPRDELYSDLFYMKVKEALKNGVPLPIDDQLYGFPNSLLIPKGKAEGMPFQLFAYVNEVEDEDLVHIDSRIWGKKVFDGKPMGFPLDRPMFAYNFTVPNMYFKDVSIFHKD